MTISPTSLLTEISNRKSISLSNGILAYFRERARNKLFDKIIAHFLERERRGEITRADLARRLNKRPEQITRWLSSPGNWTIDTVSDLTLAICDGELDFEIAKFSDMPTRNCNQLDIISEKTSENFSLHTSTAKSKSSKIINVMMYAE